MLTHFDRAGFAAGGEVVAGVRQSDAREADLAEVETTRGRGREEEDRPRQPRSGLDRTQS
jgi:hypothetical protein